MGDSLQLPDGRTVGYAVNGPEGAPAVLWCHGGPGSRLEPGVLARNVDASDLRVVGIDRPGYGQSTPQPERTIADWIPDALAVLDHLGIDRVVAIGVSTGGAYALALAAVAPERVAGVVACCALTDMRWAEGRAVMPERATTLWDAPDRATALQYATDLFGADGSKMGEALGDADLAPADMALLADAAWIQGWMDTMPEVFAQGVVGYTDDRRADGPGWGSFDVDAVVCPVVVIHGGCDSIVPVAHAHHTAAIVPNAELRISDDDGHLSIVREAIPVARQLSSG